MRESWGKCLTEEYDSNKVLVINFFEETFMTIVARIVQSDEGATMKLKDAGNIGKSPTLTRSKSVVDVKVSEAVISQALEILFKELERFNNGKFKIQEEDEYNYHESFLNRILLILEKYTSIATISSHPQSMIKRIANPFQLSQILHCFLKVTTKNKILTLKILLNIIQMQLPSQILEDAVSKLSQVEKFDQRWLKSERFEKSMFLRFLYVWLKNVLSKRWVSDNGDDVVHSYVKYERAVTNVFYKVFREILN